MHQTEQSSKIFIATVTQYQLLNNAERLRPTDTVLHHCEDTAGTTALMKHIYAQKHTVRTHHTHRDE